ncbi:BbrUII/HgiDII family restriction enzyme [Klebsiella pneumoniae]|uniref:BbrUII/HgiDII family restriction enzyme n=1 Tax=Klebsiella pneumoniae complex TaxID=3390273 RepID=UPI0007D0C111|nr:MULTISPECIES: ATP-binding protein [Klebsiella]VVJ29430.1 DNA mismatch repair protein [Klebsiella quasipneumoniae]HDS4970414.1 ATP-binding protein [Klebsiella pneumoniae subsp. pneumoniae]EKT9440992.1 ATP-binding protein [Klebsiella pneumoniae]MCM5829107.1 ATP-binding protein [Klebsiella pneumoniae]SBN34911.1 DNA mismatch repair protein [Klebsiella variicola]
MAEHSEVLPQGESSTHTYEMQVSLSVLGHLGINLYSNVAAVITETVANAWDADASEVHIKLTPDEITISDNGFGMTINDMNSKYLTVGYQKRNNKDQLLTPKGRLPMGRKGIGKLSLFSIAKTVIVESIKDGEQHGLIMEVPAIEHAIKSGAGRYYPEPLDATQVTVSQGTLVTLRDLNRSRIPATASALRKKLARRFSIIGSNDFKVYVDGVEVTAKEREDLKHVQFVWDLNSGIDFLKECPGLITVTDISSALVESPRFDPKWNIKGWIGSIKQPSQLNTPEGNLNSIVVLSRGRLFQENILDDINDGGIYTKYLTGQLEADFLDTDEDEDIATSDRQRVVEDDPRYQYLKSLVKIALRKVAGQWSALREMQGAKEAKESNPVLVEWISSLKPASQGYAEKMIAQIESLPLEDKPQEKKELFKHAIFAFERLRIKEMSRELAEAVIFNAEKLLPLLEKQDDLEATLYYEIAKSRVDVIQSFKGLVDNDEKEKVLQRYLFEHLWLLDPSWERIDGSPIMESRVNQEWDKIDAGLTEDERKGRMDIKYRSSAGKHIIIELKRASVLTSVATLVAQGNKYRQAVIKCAKTVDPSSTPSIDVIFVLGREPSDYSFDPSYTNLQLQSVNGRVVYYDGLINSAQNSYREYTEKQATVARIAEIVKKLDD